MEVKNIIKVTTPQSITDLFPTFQYKFENELEHEEATSMYTSLLEFLKENYELALNNSNSIEYKEGFQQALALTHLWIDSLYLSK